MVLFWPFWMFLCWEKKMVINQSVLGSWSVFLRTEAFGPRNQFVAIHSCLWTWAIQWPLKFCKVVLIYSWKFSDITGSLVHFQWHGGNFNVVRINNQLFRANEFDCISHSVFHLQSLVHDVSSIWTRPTWIGDIPSLTFSISSAYV